MGPATFLPRGGFAAGVIFAPSGSPAMIERQPSQPEPESAPPDLDQGRHHDPAPRHRPARRHAAPRGTADALSGFHAEMLADTAARLAAMPPAYAAAFRGALARRGLYADLPAQRAAAAEACRAVFAGRRHRLAALAAGEGLPAAAGLAAAADRAEGRRDGLATLAGHMHAHAGRADQWKVFGEMLREGW